MKIVIDTTGYGTSQGRADQITLPNGKYLYTGVTSLNSHRAKEKGLKVESVEYFGACIYANINDRAHRGLPIQINGRNIKDFIGKIATEKECEEFFK